MSMKQMTKEELHFTTLLCHHTTAKSKIMIYNVVKVLLEIGSNLDVADIYGKTALHYAEMKKQYELLIKYGGEERKKDNNGHTPRYVWQLREAVTTNIDNAKKFPIGKKALYTSRDILQL